MGNLSQQWFEKKSEGIKKIIIIIKKKKKVIPYSFDDY